MKRAPLIDACMRAFEEYYEKYLQTLDLSLLQEEYNRELVNVGREVTVLAPAGDYTGVSHGINREGELVVELDVYKRQPSCRGREGEADQGG